MDKGAVARHFSRAAASYDQVAELQRQVADALLAEYQQSTGTILDLGCGTGYLSGQLQAGLAAAGQQTSRVVALDLAPGMLAQARQQHPQPGIHWLQGDAEALPLAEDCCSAVLSSLAVQWCSDPQQLFRECWRVLKPGGQLLLSTLGPATLHELRQAWAESDNAAHVNRFWSLASWQRAAGAGWQGQWLQRNWTLYYPRAWALMKELKLLGASHVEGERSVQGLGGRQRLQQVEQGYRQFVTEQGLPATYEVFLAVLRKPE